MENLIFCAVSLKRYLISEVFLRALRNFPDYFFYRTHLPDSFCNLNAPKDPHKNVTFRVNFFDRMRQVDLVKIYLNKIALLLFF